MAILGSQIRAWCTYSSQPIFQVCADNLSTAVDINYLYLKSVIKKKGTPMKKVGVYGLISILVVFIDMVLLTKIMFKSAHEIYHKSILAKILQSQYMG